MNKCSWCGVDDAVYPNIREVDKYFHKTIECKQCFKKKTDKNREQNIQSYHRHLTRSRGNTRKNKSESLRDFPRFIW